MTNRDLIRQLVRQANKAPKEVLLRQQEDTSLPTEWEGKNRTAEPPTNARATPGKPRRHRR